MTICTIGIMAIRMMTISTRATSTIRNTIVMIIMMMMIRIARHMIAII